MPSRWRCSSALGRCRSQALEGDAMVFVIAGGGDEEMTCVGLGVEVEATCKAKA